VNYERVVATVSGQTYTLPGLPQKDWQVAISVGNFVDTVVDPNGYRIMGDPNILTLDTENRTTYFYYVDSTLGWRIS
jgi:hypothetical protein